MGIDLCRYPKTLDLAVMKYYGPEWGYTDQDGVAVVNGFLYDECGLADCIRSMSRNGWDGAAFREEYDDVIRDYRTLKLFRNLIAVHELCHAVEHEEQRSIVSHLMPHRPEIKLAEAMYRDGMVKKRTMRGLIILYEKHMNKLNQPGYIFGDYAHSLGLT
jgi:hypothetical protein